MHSPPLEPLASPQTDGAGAAGLVLVAPGSTLAGPAGRQLAARLAEPLGLWLLSEQAVQAALGPEQGARWATDPAGVLSYLSGLAELPPLEPGWLLPLPLDPGADLAASGCWADALAAWRQPALLLLPAAMPGQAPQASGLARAYGALLRSAGVPLLGLVQLGGFWDPDARRQDGLPWLGWLPADDAQPDVRDDALEALRQVCRRRWRALRPGAQCGQA